MNLALALSDLNQKEDAISILMKIPKISDDGTKDPLSHVTTQVKQPKVRREGGQLARLGL